MKKAPLIRNPRIAARLVLFSILLMAVMQTVAVAGEPLGVGDRKQLFIDERFIEKSENVKLTTNPAQKLGVVMQSETTPFEHHPMIILNVFEDGGKFKMYYGCLVAADEIKGTHPEALLRPSKVSRALAYAESTDGITWTRPPLGVVSIHGNTNNNVLMVDEAGSSPEESSIFKDDHDPSPERRYKLFMSIWNRPNRPNENPEADGIYAYQSADGIHFTKVRRVCPLTSDNPFHAQWDPAIKKYVIITRAYDTQSENARQIGRIETDDLMQPWPLLSAKRDKRGTVNPENIRVVMKADAKVDPRSDLYYSNGMIYPWAQDVYMMFPTPFRHFYPDQQPFILYGAGEKGGDFGYLETQFASSRDGIHWNRYDQQPYFPLGTPDEWDRYYCVTGRGMIRKGNYLYQYYISAGRTHDGGIVRKEHEDLVPLVNRMGVVRQRLDGFVSADVDNKGGWLETPPIVFSGKHLRLNIDTGGMGTAFVEIRDSEGQPIPGFTLAESEETGGNYIDQAVYWKGSSDVSSLAGKPVKLYFKLKRAKLYAFQFTKE